MHHEYEDAQNTKRPNWKDLTGGLWRPAPVVLLSSSRIDHVAEGQPVM